MRYTGILVAECREDTGNQSYSSTTGITDAKIVRALNYGLENAQGFISRVAPRLFLSEQIISIVANQEAYSISDRLYLGTRIVNVEYSFSGEERDYRKIYDQALIARDSDARDHAVCYIRRNGELLIQPIPTTSSGTLRVTYERQLDGLALRVGQITAITIASGQVTAITINAATDDPTTIGTTGGFLCINDLNGVVKAYNIPFSAYNTTSGVFTLTATSVVSGQTPAIGDYVTFGQYTTTHGKLADPVERYVKAYANWELLSKDTASATKAGYFEKQLITIKTEIMESYQEADKDDIDIQICNWDLILG